MRGLDEGGSARVDRASLPEQEELAADFRLAMRRTAAGVAIVTTRHRGAPAGITVSSFSSLSMDPPSVLACVNSESRTLAAILESGFFAANVLADHQSALAEVFSGIAFGSRRFHHGDWIKLRTGAPVLAAALACFDCRLATSFVFGSHRIIVGEVLAVKVNDAKPLVYHARTYGRFGA
jgi:flavin reductase (DIM6/NTAB) family NADH-FMN oxidoreductase RutF